MSRKVASEEALVKIGHALRAQVEMKLLAEEFLVLARQTSVPTPAIDRLYEYVGAEAESAAGESPEDVGGTGRA